MTHVACRPLRCGPLGVISATKVKPGQPLDCLPSFEPTTTSAPTCVGGAWRVGTCDRYCPDPQGIEHALTSHCNHTRAGEKCQVWCDRGFLPSPLALTCDVSGAWSQGEFFPVCLEAGYDGSREVLLVMDITGLLPHAGKSLGRKIGQQVAAALELSPGQVAVSPV